MKRISCKSLCCLFSMGEGGGEKMKRACSDVGVGGGVKRISCKSFWCRGRGGMKKVWFGLVCVRGGGGEEDLVSGLKGGGGWKGSGLVWVCVCVWGGGGWRGSGVSQSAVCFQRRPLHRVQQRHADGVRGDSAGHGHLHVHGTERSGPPCLPGHAARPCAWVAASPKWRLSH